MTRDAAGVEHEELQAAHSFRQQVVSELLARTGNLVLARCYVGDTDLRTPTRSYVRDRQDDLRNAAALLDEFDQRLEGKARGNPEGHA